MTEEERETRRKELIQELTKLVQEWVHITDYSDGPTGILTGTVISFEATRFDDEGTAVFRTDHLALPPTSNAGAIGLMQDALWSMHHNSYSHFGPTNMSNG